MKIPAIADMGAAIIGFESINDILDIFPGDAWLALQTDGDTYAGMIAYGLSDAGALQELLMELLSSSTSQSGQKGYLYLNLIRATGSELKCLLPGSHSPDIHHFPMAFYTVELERFSLLVKVPNHIRFLSASCSPCA